MSITMSTTVSTPSSNSTCKDNPWTEVLEKVTKLAKKTQNEVNAARHKANNAQAESDAAQEKAAVAQVEADLALAKVVFTQNLTEVCFRQAEEARLKLETLLKRAKEWEDSNGCCDSCNGCP